MDHARSLSLDEEGRHLVEALGGRWTPSGGMCRCPVHPDRTPSLSVRPGRTRLLLHCFAGCNAGEILRRLETLRLIETGPAQSPVPAERQSNSADARRIWSEARPIAATAAERYLCAAAWRRTRNSFAIIHGRRSARGR